MFVVEKIAEHEILMMNMSGNGGRMESEGDVFRGAIRFF